MSQRLIFETFHHTLQQGFSDLDRLIIVAPIETVVFQSTDRLQVVNDRPMPRDAVDLAATMVTLPLRVDQQILGAVYLERVNPEPWTDCQLGLLQGLCDQMAIALYYFQPRIEPLKAVACNLARTFQQLVENANDIIFIITIEGRFSYLSPKFQALVGTDPQTYINQPFSQLTHPDDLPEIDRIMQLQLQKREEVSEFEFRLRRHDGSYIWAAANNSAPIEDAFGNLIGFQGIVRDINKRKLAEAQLHTTHEQLFISNAELAHATRLKDEFLANMSHELRTPLNAVLGISEAMLDEVYGPLSEQYRKSIKIIEQSGQHLLELINDILDLAKIEAGKLEIRPSQTSLKYLCESSLNFVRQTALNKNIQLHHHETYGDHCIEVDERRMRQVLINLLSNAVKFTPSGGSVELVAQYDADRQQFRFQVRDTGIGIAAAHLPRLFQPFIQIDSSLNRQFSGTGLGLTLVKRIIDLHGGTIAVESDDNIGSCFTIVLPIRQSHPIAVATPIAELNPIKVLHPEAPRILLAEDNAMNIEIMTDYLNAQGYEVIVAKNGIDAIALTQSHQPQLILMDIQMPRMDGLEATRQIRQDQQYQHIPIVALTALAMPGDADRCRAAGANDYLAKPVKLKQLAAVVERHLAAFAY